MDETLSNVLLIIAAIFIGFPMTVFFVCVLALAILNGLVRILRDTGRAITIPAVLLGGFNLLKDKLDLDRDKQRKDGDK